MLVRDWATNLTFWSPFLGWLIAQGTKMLCGLGMGRPVNIRYLISTGGMPSAHSAAVSGLATSVAWRCGTGSADFAIALTFAILTMIDASTVRRAAGMQARILNEMIDEYFKEHRFSEHKLMELLGHTRLEVFMGMIMGILIAFVLHSLAAIRG